MITFLLISTLLYFLIKPAVMAYIIGKRQEEEARVAFAKSRAADFISPFSPFAGLHIDNLVQDAYDKMEKFKQNPPLEKEDDE